MMHMLGGKEMFLAWIQMCVMINCFGAATEKARVARIVQLRGTTRNSLADDLSTLGCF